LFGGTTLGEQEDRQEAIKRIFNIEYNPINKEKNGKNGSNAVADDNSQSGEGRQGSPTDGKGRERAESGSGSADGAGGTESHDEEVDDRGDSSHRDYSIHSGDSIGATSSSEKKETERQGVNTEPSEKQKEAGNYKKGHIKVDGYDITIENPKGSTRSGKDASGKAWSVPMHYDYGYIKGTEGVDGDHIDVYLSDNPTSGNVYVVDQIDQKTGKFDEHKVMYGFPSKEAAVEAYKGQYEDGWKVGPVTEVSREDFKKWVDSSTRKTKPFAEYKSVKEAALKGSAQNGEAPKVLLKRAGDFYELYGDDAKKASEILGITLTKRRGGNYMSGFPKWSLDTYLPKLLKAGVGADITDENGKVVESVRPEITGNGLDKEMDDYDTVSKFNVATIGKDGDDVHPSILDTAEQVSNEQAVEKKANKQMEMHQVDVMGLMADLSRGRTTSLNEHFTDNDADADTKAAHDNMMKQLDGIYKKDGRQAVEGIINTRDHVIDFYKGKLDKGETSGEGYGVHYHVDYARSLARAIGEREAAQEFMDNGFKTNKPLNSQEESNHNVAGTEAWTDADIDALDLPDAVKSKAKAALHGSGSMTDHFALVEARNKAEEQKKSTDTIKKAMTGKKTEGKKNNEKKKVVSSQQKEKEPSQFDELFDDNSTNQKQAEDGLQRNDELRPEGLPSDSDHPGEHSERQGQGTSQGREGSDRERKGTGVRGVLSRNEQPVRSGERLNQHNNHAERGKDYAPTGVDDRIEANIAAIEMLHKITDEGRQATPSEMKVLRRFSGWGGLGKAFKEPEWGARNPYYNRLKALLSDEEWQEAEMSRNSAYFTPATVIDNLWDVARALGFKGGNVLEGSAGIGNIIGLMPTDMSERSHIQAVEIDSTTGGILRLLYPDAKTDIQGFEQTKVRNGSVDLAITNVPFVTGLHVNDTTGDKDLSRKFGDIHDFCIAKNVRKLKPGGIGIFITSSGTMDKSQKLRDWLVNDGDADVIGAFRMNNETFGGTSATSDIIVVRKRVDGKKSPMAIDVSKVGVERMGTYHDRLDGDKELPVDYNQYFIDHPENMGGKMYLAGEKGDTYRPSSKSLYPVSNISQKKRMEAWVKGLGEMYASAQRQAEEQGEDAASAQNLTDDAQESTVYDTLGDDVKEGSMLVDKQGRLCVATYGEAVPLAVNSNKVKGHTKVECFNAYKRIKDAVKKVLDYQTQHDDNKGLQPLLAEFNNAYDTFVNTYGHLNKNTAISFLKNDMDFSGTAALEGFEEYNDKNGKRLVKYTKSDIFSQRVVEKESGPHPTTVKDGVITSIYKNGRIDLGYIAGELGKSREEVKQSILDEGLGFEDPVSGETVVSYEYLSGNVREKLHQAENEGGRYDANIKALQKVIPMNIPSHLIEYSLGSSWLDPELYEQYIEEKTGIKVKARNIDGTWAVSAPSYGLSNEKNRMLGVTSSIVGKTVFGHELIIAAMKNTSIVVQKTEKSYDGHTETITDKEATRLCGEKIDEIRQDFKDWARGKMQQDPDLSKKYEERYNDQFNNYVPKEIPDSFVPKYFSGATHKIVLRPHQAKAAIRGTTQNVLLAHEVGSGKTFTLISTAMEMRRLGTARKPMVVVQNATVGQFVSSAKFLYPNAKILTIESKDRNAEGRKAFYAKIKYNDWDMVVIPQSVLDMIPDSEERQLAFVQAKIAEKEQVLRQMAEADVDDPIMMRRAQKELETLQEEMNTLSEQVAEKKKDSKKAAVARQNAKVRAEQMLDRKVDDVANFDDMGIDALLVDEAHEYKHLGFATAMQRGVKGVDPSYSKKCQGLYLKCQSVMEKTGGKNIIFATGTPISNTAAEIWTFMKYLMPEDMMKDYGIYYFDDFVRNFGDISQIPEFNTAGKFVQNNRFKGYQNLPELVRIWSGVSDTVLSSEIADLQAKIPQMQGGKAQDIYLPQTRALRSIMKYVRAQLKDYENMSGKEKKEHSALPLMMYGIAKAAAVDPRLVQSDAEDDEHSKTNACVRETLKALDESKKYQGTVAIFADNYQNKHSGFNLFDDIKEKLVKSGVPEKQIVVIKPGMTVEKKTAIFDKVDAGEVRVVLGTTATLGTGVNMQERLYTLIHLDAPNRPMDYTQRNGRILRQGNLHKEWNIPVKVIRFGVEDSLDVTAYQRLKTKGAIADSIMHGKDLMSNSMENRTIEEEEDQFGDTVAQLSGSEYALLKQQAERELRKYEGKKKQWEADQVYIHSQKPRLEGQIEAAKKRSRESANALDALSKSKEKGIVVGKKHFAGVDAMGDFIKDFNKKVKASEDDIRSHKSESADHVLDVTVDGHTFKVRLHLYKDMGESRGNLFEVVKRRMTYSCAELSLSDIPVKGSLLRNALEDIEQNVVTGNDFRDRKERAEAEADRLTKELTMIKSREGKQFEYGEQLEAAKQKVDEYTKKMNAELDEKEKKYAEMDKEVATSNLDDKSQEDDVLYRIEDDPEELDRLDKEPKVKVYRAMQLIDGKLYPPMAAKVNGSLVEPAEPGQWLRADEHPELAKNGLFTLNKGGKDASGKRLGSVPAAYNPYWHTSRSPLNDQFSSAYKRPNLVTVEVEIPKSELTSGYHADGAKDPVGEMSWHAGPVSSKLPKEKERKVILSRWCKVVRVVPDAEVADKVAGMLKGENISVPDNTVTPSLRRELEKRGVPITHTKMVEDWERKYPSTQSGLSREGNGAYSDDELSMINDPFVKMLGEKARTAKQRKAFAARERRSMAAAVKELAEKLHLDNVEIRSAAQQLTEQATKQERRKARAKGYYDRKSGTIVINIDNHRDVEDAVQTLLHEAVAHYGLRQLFGSHFDTFLDNVYKAADMDVRQRITDLALRKYKGDFHVATEEYLASLAENTNFEHMPDSFWSKIKTLFLKMLHSIGFDGFAGMGVTLSDNELRYILWRSYENLKEPGRYRSILGEAEDVAKQAELKVGNYGETDAAAQQRPTELEQEAAEGDGVAEKDYKPSGKGYFGNIYTQFKGKVMEGINFLSRVRGGALQGVWHRNGIGDIDLVWGNEGGGLCHILKKHINDKDFKNKADFANRLNDIINNGKVDFENGDKVVLKKDGYVVTIRKNIRERGKKIADENWVLTAYNKDAPATTTAPADGTHGSTAVAPGASSGAKLGKSSESGVNKGENVSEPSVWGKKDLLSKAEQVTEGISPELLFRDSIEDDDNTARVTYDMMANQKKNIIREAWQDSMINVRNLQKAVLKQRGETLKPYEDAYEEENRMHGKSKTEEEVFTRNYYDPLLDSVNALAKAAKVSVGDVVQYMMAKHGLERNEVFAERDAQAAWDEYQEKQKLRFAEYQNTHPNSNKTIADFMEKEYDDFYQQYREKDYSGLTELTGTDNVQDAEAEAKSIVSAMESKSDTSDLWQKTNAATKWTLKKAKDCGIVSMANYEQVRDMFDYYIPLRGWKDETADDIYDYVGIRNNGGDVFSPTVKKARGRRSEADNPIAYIGSMAVSAIVQGNKNKVKQTFLGFVENHPTNLVTISDMWYRNYGTEQDADWREEFPDIPEDATADEIASLLDQFGKDMEALASQGMATKKKGRLKISVPIKKSQALEHHVKVSLNGKEYVMYINGNPRAAQALNGTRARLAAENSHESAAIANVNRWLGQAYTSLSPAFTVSNLLRDYTMATALTFIKDGPDYARRFQGNMALLGGPTRMFWLMHKYKSGNLNMNNETERLFHEFMTEGGETGYTSLKDIERYKVDMQKKWKRMNRSDADPRELWHDFTDGVENVNRCIEDTVRFATYMTSRKGGKTVRDSVTDAKNITLNFNRKGSGELGNSTFRHLYIFVNPAIQGLNTVASAVKHHPVRFSLAAGFIVSMGMMQPLLIGVAASIFGGGDDGDDWNPSDEYWNLPAWQRRNNFVFWIPGTHKFGMIPLAQEFRMLHGFGETLYSYTHDHADDNPALELASQAADLLPLDMTGNSGNPMVTLMPSLLQPIAQVAANTEFTGRPIYKDSEWNKYEPAWQKAYVGTPSFLVSASKGINEITGGNDHRQGWLETFTAKDIHWLKWANNPAIVDHLMKGYLGGPYSFVTGLGGIAWKAMSKGVAPDAQEIPVVNRIVTAPREKEQGGKQKLPDWYYDLSEENDRHQNEFSGYKKDYMTGDVDGKKKFNALIKSKDFAKWQEVNTYIGAVQQIRTAMSYTKDPAEKAELQKNLDEVLVELKKLKDK
jgi:N12 class adenine-specific DNA methylase